MSDIKHPRKLERDTIVDCIIEVRFQLVSESAREIFPGVLYGELKKNYPTMQKTPVAEIPQRIRETDQKLRYQPTVEFVGALGRVRVADFAIQITVSYPYPGWEAFKPTAEQVLRVLTASELVAKYERISILYNNIIFASENTYDLSPLELNLQVGRGLEVAGRGTMVRVELPHELGVSIVQIQTGAEARIGKPGSEPTILHGPHLSIDTIAMGDMNGFEEMMERLEHVRTVERDLYFRMIKPETWEQLGPIWEK